MSSYKSNRLGLGIGEFLGKKKSICLHKQMSRFECCDL